MSKAKRIVLVFLLAGLASLVATAARAATTEALLGHQGEVYRLSSASSPAGEPYLLLAIQHPDGSTEASAVPETEGPGRENSPYLIFDNGSRTVFIVWEERINHIHSLIRLIGFREGEWTDVIEVSEGSFGFKSEPTLAATQDEFAIGEPGAARTLTRTVLHVVWVEERSEGQLVVYAPVTLLDGRYIGQRRIFELSRLNDEEAAQPTDLWQVTAPTVTASSNDHSVIVGLIDPDSGRIGTLRVTMLSGELSIIADELRAHLIDVGVHHDWQSSEGLIRLADVLRGHLIDIGYRLDPQILRQVADGLRGHLIDIGARYGRDELRRLAGDLRGHLIDIGFRLDGGGLRRAAAASSAAVFEVAASDENVDDPTAALTHVAEITLTAEWTRPSEAVAGSTLLVARSGNAALLWWIDGQAVHYRETFGGEWSAVMRLPLGESLDAEQAVRLLHNRIRNR